MASNETRTASPEDLARSKALYSGFIKAATVCTVAIVAILGLMAIFLL